MGMSALFISQHSLVPLFKNAEKMAIAEKNADCREVVENAEK